MKNISIVLLILVAQVSFAQEEKSDNSEDKKPNIEGKKINIKYGSHGGWLGNTGLAIEFKTAPRISLGFTMGKRELDGHATSVPTTGRFTGVGVDIRYYSNGALSTSLYISGGLVIGSAKASNFRTTVSAGAVSLFMQVGKMWVWDNFNVEASIGSQIISGGDLPVSATIDTSNLSLSSRTLDINFGIAAGFVF